MRHLSGFTALKGIGSKLLEMPGGLYCRLFAQLQLQPRIQKHSSAKKWNFPARPKLTRSTRKGIQLQPCLYLASADAYSGCWASKAWGGHGVEFVSGIKEIQACSDGKPLPQLQRKRPQAPLAYKGIICTYTHLSLSIDLSVYLSIYRSIYLYLSIYIYLSICLSMYIFGSKSFYLSFFLSIYICLSTYRYLYIYQEVQAAAAPQAADTAIEPPGTKGSTGRGQAKAPGAKVLNCA